MVGFISLHFQVQMALFPGLALFWFGSGQGWETMALTLPVNAVFSSRECAVEIKALPRPLRKERSLPAANVVAKTSGRRTSATGVESRWVALC